MKREIEGRLPDSVISMFGEAGISAKLPYQLIPLEQGLSHQSYQLCQGAVKRHIKLLRRAHWPWLSVRRESAIQLECSHLGITPTLLAHNRSAIISQWVDGQTEVTPSQAIVLLQRFSTINQWLPKLNGSKRFLQYLTLTQLTPAVQQNLYQDFVHHYQRLMAHRGPMGKTHLDPHQDNFLVANQCFIIDFEYAAYAPLSLELAALVLAYGGAEALRHDFNATYQLNISQAELQDAITVMQALQDIWYFIDNPRPSQTALEALSARLQP